MKLDLKRINPETPTEAVLKEYASYLERALMDAQSERNIMPSLHPRQQQIELQPTEQLRFWHGAVRCTVQDHAGTGVVMKAYTKPLGFGETFGLAVYVSKEELLTPTFLANRLAELHKEGLMAIGKIFQQK